MKDNLESFIHDHRNEFDDAVPEDKIWSRLENNLQRGGEGHNQKPIAKVHRISHSGKRWLSAAAVFLLCISLAAFVRGYQVKKQMMDTSIPQDLQNAQAYYENRITVKIDRIKSMESLQNNNADTSLWQLFGQRDEEYKRIKKALQENPGDAHVRAAFVEYYRSRLSVLNQIEEHLEAPDTLATQPAINNN
ncbi:MAG: hypothetical protein ACRDE2_04510 [Chitinophagaceae bacterium]